MSEHEPVAAVPEKKPSAWVPQFRFHAEETREGGLNIEANWNLSFMVCAVLIAALLGYLAVA